MHRKLLLTSNLSLAISSLRIIKTRPSAIDAVLASPEWATKLADANKKKKNKVIIDQTSLKELLGDHYEEHCFGLTRDGPREHADGKSHANQIYGR